MGFSGSSDGKEFACNAGDLSSIPGEDRGDREGPLEKGISLQYYSLTPVFWPGELHGQRSLASYIVHGVAKSQTQLKQLTFSLSRAPEITEEKKGTENLVAKRRLSNLGIMQGKSTSTKNFTRKRQGGLEFFIVAEEINYNFTMKQLFEKEQMSVKSKCKNKISRSQNGRCESLRLSWEFSLLLESQGIYLKTAAMGSSIQLLSHVQLFSAPWTAACQTSLSITNSW